MDLASDTALRQAEKVAQLFIENGATSTYIFGNIANKKNGLEMKMIVEVSWATAMKFGLYFASSQIGRNRRFDRESFRLVRFQGALHLFPGIDPRDLFEALGGNKATMDLTRTYLEPNLFLFPSGWQARLPKSITKSYLGHDLMIELKHGYRRYNSRKKNFEPLAFCTYPA